MLTGEHKAEWPALQRVKAVLKSIHSKSMDILQAFCVDTNLGHIICHFLQNIQELACRGSVEISPELQVQAVVLSGGRYAEILCHGISFLPMDDGLFPELSGDGPGLTVLGIPFLRARGGGSGRWQGEGDSRFVAGPGMHRNPAAMCFDYAFCDTKT